MPSLRMREIWPPLHHTPPWHGRYGSKGRANHKIITVQLQKIDAIKEILHTTTC